MDLEEKKEVDAIAGRWAVADDRGFVVSSEIILEDMEFLLGICDKLEIRGDSLDRLREWHSALKAGEIEIYMPTACEYIISVVELIDSWRNV